MKKKQATSINKLLGYLGAALAIVAFVMIFLPQIVAVSTDATYNGIAIAFGKPFDNSQIDLGGIIKYSRVIDFSFPNLLAYILVTVGLVVLVLQAIGLFKGKLFTGIAALCLIAGGILFFFALDFSTITVTGSAIGVGGTGTKKFSEYNTDSITTYKLGYAAITGGITAICSGVFTLGKAVLSK